MNTVTASNSSYLSHSSFYRHYVLLLLLLVGICSWSDRQVLSIVLEAIRRDFHLTDTELGLLGGTAFGLFYVAVALPIASLADRANRRNIISAAVFLWSVMTALTAGATSYGALLICRMGVGIGEAGGSAPSQSLISDLYPPQRRGFAMGVLYTYIPMGYLLSYSLGGWINDSMGWRTAFLSLGIPGIVLALFVRFTIREPERGRLDVPTTPVPVANESLIRTVQSLLSLRAMRHVCLGGAAHGLGMFAVAVWLPTFFMRAHGASATTVGTRLALIMGLGGILGTLSGGRLADRFVTKTRNPGWYSWMCAVALIISVPFSICVYSAKGMDAAFLFLIIPMVLNHMIIGPAVASIQGLVGARRRAVAAALYLFLVNLISAGFGPVLIGAISDTLHARLGAASLRYALLMTVPVTAAWAALHFYIAGRALAREFPRASLRP